MNNNSPTQPDIKTADHKNGRKMKGDTSMGKLEGKKLLLLGERDGVPSPAMEAVFKNSGAEIVFSATECFV